MMEVLMHEASNGQPQGNGGSNTNVSSSLPPTSTGIPTIVVAPAPSTHENKGQSNENLQQSDNEQSSISSFTPKEPLNITFENITYTVSLGFRRGKKEILHGIHGRLPAQQLTALMGPSGAGKSTLLDILSGFRITGVGGNVYVNGRVRHLDSFRRCSAYITQDDRLEPLLTVIENMRVSADLKLPTSTPRYEKETIIEEILTTLGLYEHMNTRTGRLSGGQKKRLSIALELVNNPNVMFLDEPTTGLDSSSCMQVVNLLKVLVRQGRTIICTIHQPSASLFQIFDQVYILAKGECLFQGATEQLIPYLENMKLPCPMYHNPADYVIEIACGEYGEDKIEALVAGSQNGRSLQYFTNPASLKDAKTLRAMYPLKKDSRFEKHTNLQATPLLYQIRVLLRRGFVMCKRDPTLTHLRIIVNILVGVMLGLLYLQMGDDGHRVKDNYNLLFAILIHHMMTTMMLTIVTFPAQMDILMKEHFNRWYNLKAFYTAVTIVDIPVSIISCLLFTIVVYLMSAQPLEIDRFIMFFAVSLLVCFIAQGTGLMIGAVFNVVNGTFVGPTLAVPMMMFAGFGVTLRDLPSYLKWGSYISYLRYGLEGYVGSIYGYNRPVLPCGASKEFDIDIRYCHYRNPTKFLSDIAMQGDQFFNDIAALTTILIITRCGAYLLLKWKIVSVR